MGAAGILVTGLVVGGCASGAWPAASRSPQRVIAAPRDALWPQLKDALRDERYTIRSEDASRGTLVAQRDYPGDAVSLYAADPVARRTLYWWSLESTLIVTLTAVDAGQTLMVVDSRLTGREDPATLSTIRRAPRLLPLRSNGTLERQLLRRLEAAAGLADLDHRRPADIR